MVFVFLGKTKGYITNINEFLIQKKACNSHRTTLMDTGPVFMTSRCFFVKSFKKTKFENNILNLLPCTEDNKNEERWQVSA